jgi:hypothetical protein
MNGYPLDTVLNLAVFAYLGALIWLAVRPVPEPSEDSSTNN